jgi:hypothetical protein
MRILAASLIDGENISPKYAEDVEQVLSDEGQHGVSVVARILVGNSQALGAWYGALSHYHYLAKTHAGGRNAADQLLRDEACTLAEQGVRRFYLVSNDAGFAETARLLQLQGCQVIGLGQAQAGRQWRARCDVFVLLGADRDHTRAALAALPRPPHVLKRSNGGAMSSFDATFLPGQEKTKEVLQTLYGSVNQPPLLTNILSLLLAHTFTALCLTEQESTRPGQWSVDEDVEILMSGMQDPIIALILEQDARLRATWQAVAAFAHRCHDAYAQGRAAARIAFPHFPRHRLSVLQQEHLISLEASFHYHASPEDAQHAYPGYTPKAEHKVLLRWFRHGYFSGAEADAEEPKQKNRAARW